MSTEKAGHELEETACEYEKTKRKIQEEREEVNKRKKSKWKIQSAERKQAVIDFLSRDKQSSFSWEKTHCHQK